MSATGDPALDSIVTWITNGGKLQSAGAILGIGMAIKSVCIPIIGRICAKYKINFSGPNKLHTVMGVGIVIVGLINAIGQQHLVLGDVVVMGIEAGIAAVGIHAGMSTVSDASKVQAAAETPEKES